MGRPQTLHLPSVPAWIRCKASRTCLNVSVARVLLLERFGHTLRDGGRICRIPHLSFSGIARPTFETRNIRYQFLFFVEQALFQPFDVHSVQPLFLT